jgi:hypothetical protein
VGEVYGTAGEAYSEPGYRVGIRWESPRWVISATYANAFDGSGGAGFELGIMYFTDPRFVSAAAKLTVRILGGRLRFAARDRRSASPTPPIKCKKATARVAFLYLAGGEGLSETIPGFGPSGALRATKFGREATLIRVWVSAGNFG